MTFWERLYNTFECQMHRTVTCLGFVWIGKCVIPRQCTSQRNLVSKKQQHVSTRSSETALHFLDKAVFSGEMTRAPRWDMTTRTWIVPKWESSFSFISFRIIWSYGSPVAFSYSCWSLSSLSEIPFICSKSLSISAAIFVRFLWVFKAGVPDATPTVLSSWIIEQPSESKA